MVLSKQWLWHNEEDFETESLLSQSLSFKKYEMHITATFTNVVLELRKNKNLRYWFETTLTLETRISYIVTPTVIRDKFAMVLKWNLNKH